MATNERDQQARLARIERKFGRQESSSLSCSTRAESWGGAEVRIDEGLDAIDEAIALLQIRGAGVRAACWHIRALAGTTGGSS